MTLEAELLAHAAALGFTLSGIAPATEADGFGRFCDWLDRGYGVGMTYLADKRDLRQHPRAVLAPVRSVVMLGYEYGPGLGGPVASYAQHPDYHQLLWPKLNALRDWLTARVPGSVSHGVADSAPILERDFARRAGLGWAGKNTMLINKHRGSYFHLAAFLTSLELAPSEPHAANHCGTCTRCLDACPTQAFPEPGVLDARKCISYLTIEHKGAIPLELREGVGGWLFGCDVCQQVCPWNRHAADTLAPPRPELAGLDPAELLTLTEAEFPRRFAGTAFLRARRAGMARNAAVVLGNRATLGERELEALRGALADADEAVREAAAWALARHR